MGRLPGMHRHRAHRPKGPQAPEARRAAQRLGHCHRQWRCPYLLFELAPEHRAMRHRAGLTRSAPAKKTDTADSCLNLSSRAWQVAPIGPEGPNGEGFL